MLVCNSCNRHYRAQDGSCPFCGTALQTTSAPSLGMTAALVLGLAMFGCNKGEDEADTTDSTEDESTSGNDTEGTDTDSSTTEVPDTGEADYGGPDDFDTETGFDTGSDTAQDTTDSGGADYGGSDSGVDTADGTDDTGTADYGGAPVPDPEIEF
jgi:hypothetical protein